MPSDGIKNTLKGSLRSVGTQISLINLRFSCSQNLTGTWGSIQPESELLTMCFVLQTSAFDHFKFSSGIIGTKSGRLTSYPGEFKSGRLKFRELSASEVGLISLSFPKNNSVIHMHLYPETAEIRRWAEFKLLPSLFMYNWMQRYGHLRGRTVWSVHCLS